MALWKIGQRDKPVGWLSRALLLGSAVGLAVLAKGTIYLLALPVLIWMLASDLKRENVKALKTWSLAGFVGVLINLGHFVRNATVLGSPVGQGASDVVYVSSSFGVREGISGVASQTWCSTRPLPSGESTRS